MGKYDDIMYLDHHVSKNHPQMSIYDRSAQFAPFAALVGYEESIENASKRKENRAILEEDKIKEIGESLSFIANHIKENIEVEIAYFDTKESKFITERGLINKIDSSSQFIRFKNGSTIKFVDIVDIVIQ